MRTFVFAVSALFSLSCNAQEDWIESSVAWFKSALPDSLKVDYDKSKIKVGSDSQQVHHLFISKDFSTFSSTPFSIETLISLNKDRAGTGPAGQKMQHYHLEFMPRYHVSEKMSVGMGIHYGSSPELRLSQGQDYRLGSETAFMLSGRFQGKSKNQWFELSVEKYNRQSATMNFHQTFTTQGFSESKFKLKYQGMF